MNEIMKKGLIRRSRGSGHYIAEAVRIPACGRKEVLSRQHDGSSNLNIGLIGLKSEDKSSFDFFHEPLYEAVSEAVADAGGRLFVMNQERDYLDFALDTGLDGILTAAIGRRERYKLTCLREAQFPFVVMGAAYDDHSMPCVAVDNTGGIEAAVDHLVNLGHCQIAFIALAMDNPDHQDRWQAYKQAIARAGIYVDPRLFLIGSVPSDFEDTRNEIERWLESGVPEFTAVIAATHLEGLAALRVLRGRGYRIPDDLSLVTFDDPPSAARMQPALTAISQPVSEIGRRSVEKLVSAIRTGQMTKGTEILPTRLIVRESTCMVPTKARWQEESWKYDLPRWIGPLCDAV